MDRDLAKHCNNNHPDKLCNKKCRLSKGHEGKHKWWGRNAGTITWENTADKKTDWTGQTT